MWAIDISQRITDWVRKKSGYEPQRTYVSMSHIADCPLEQYNYYYFGNRPTDATHRMAFLGYTFEDIMKRILTEMGVLKPITRELVADFNPLLRGHIDGETEDGDLIEIKSVSRPRFEKALMGPIREHVLQVQLYMHFGRYRHTELIYICREDFSHRVWHITYDPDKAGRLIDKARKVLKAIETQTPPQCECGRCSHASYS